MMSVMTSSFMIYYFISTKMYIFINQLYNTSSETIVMMSIVPLILGVLTSMKFFYSTKLDNKNYHLMYILMMTILSINFFSSDSFLFILTMEMCVYPMMIMILNFSKDKDKMQSMMFMFSINMAGSLPFMTFMAYSMEKMNSMLINSSEYFLIESHSKMWYAMYLILLLSKTPIMFLHFWLNKAHVSASGSSSMILASLLLKLGTFGLYKFHLLFKKVSLEYISLSSSYNLMSMMLFSIIMIRFFDMKYMIACSSVLHMALILPMISSTKSVGIISSIMMMVGHGLLSCMLFLMITILYEMMLNRSISILKSKESMNKTLSMLLMFYVFMNLGIPPFMNFYSEMMFLMLFNQLSDLLMYTCMAIMLSSMMYLMFMITSNLSGKKILMANNQHESMFMMLNTKIIMSFILLPFIN